MGFDSLSRVEVDFKKKKFRFFVSDTESRPHTSIVSHLNIRRKSSRVSFLRTSKLHSCLRMALILQKFEDAASEPRQFIIRILGWPECLMRNTAKGSGWVRAA